MAHFNPQHDLGNPYPEQESDRSFYEKTGCKTKEEFQIQKKFYTSKKFQKEIEEIRTKIGTLEARQSETPDQKEQQKIAMEIEVERISLTMREMTRKLFSNIKFPKQKKIVQKKNHREAKEEPKTSAPEKEKTEIETEKKEWNKEAQSGSDFQSISKMSWEALTSKRTIGSIEPALKGGFPMRIKFPLPHGFKMIPLKGGTMEVMPTIQNIKPGEIVIRFPIEDPTKTILPCPADSEICAFGEEDGLALLKPSPENTLTWQNADHLETEAVYCIRPKVHEGKIDASLFMASAEEQAYWKKVLPLPEDIQAECRKNPKLIPEIISGFIRKRFVYVCHDELGKLFREHADDLPLIMDELKMGHCDLLSWATCSYLRQLGTPAFVENERVTNKTGDAFMADYGHARVGVVQPNGTVSFLDPTIFTMMPKSWTPEQLSGRDVIKLSERLAEAEEEKEKREILQEFLEKHPIQNDDQVQRPAALQSAAMMLSEWMKELTDQSVVRETKEDRIVSSLPVIPEENDFEASRTALWAYCRVIADDIAAKWDQEARRPTEPLKMKPAMREVLRKTAIIMERFGIDVKEESFAIHSRNFDENYDAFMNENHEKISPETLTKFRGTASLREARKRFIGSFEFSDDFSSTETTTLDVPHFHFEKNFKELVEDFLNTNVRKIDAHNFDENIQRFYFWKLVVQAFRDEASKEYLKKCFGLSEEDFKTLARRILASHHHQDEKEKRPKMQVNHLLHWSPQLQIAKAKDDVQMMRSIFEHTPTAMALFEKKVRDILRGCDQGKKRQRREPEGHALRPAVPGDDTRAIDWKIYARTDEYHVRTPEMNLALSSPLHVYFDLNKETLNTKRIFSFGANLFQQIVLIIHTLQQSIRKEKREVWLGSTSKANYYRLKTSDDPFFLAALILSGDGDHEKKTKYYPNTSTAQGVTKNLLVFGDHEGKLESMKYLMKNQCNLSTASLIGEELYLPCQIREEWVNGE